METLTYTKMMNSLTNKIMKKNDIKLSRSSCLREQRRTDDTIFITKIHCQQLHVGNYTQGRITLEISFYCSR